MCVHVVKLVTVFLSFFGQDFHFRRHHRGNVRLLNVSEDGRSEKKTSFEERHEKAAESDFFFLLLQSKRDLWKRAFLLLTLPSSGFFNSMEAGMLVGHYDGPRPSLSSVCWCISRLTRFPFTLSIPSKSYPASSNGSTEDEG